MPKIPGVNHLDAVKALEKAGFRVPRQGKHIVMSDGVRILTIPRHNPVNAFTMGGIARDAGLSVEQLRSSFESADIQQTLGADSPVSGLYRSGVGEPLKRSVRRSRPGNICNLKHVL